MRKVSEKEHKEWLERYLKGETCRSISKDYPFSENTISKYINSQGVSRGRGKGKITKELEEKVLKEYQEDKSSTCSSLAKKYNLSDRTISSWLKNNNIPIKGFGKPTKCDKYFFDVIDTPDKAYMLGFITADGAVVFQKNICGDKEHGSLAIEVQERDIDVLKFFSSKINPDAKIIQCFYNKKRNYRVSFNSTYLARSLSKYGIVQNKSKIINQVPVELIPKELLSYYFRGLIDGDGCILKDGTINIYSGSIDFLKSVQEILVKEIKVSCLKIYKGTSYFLSWGKKEDKKKFYTFLYENLNDTFYYKRKYDRLKSALYDDTEVND